MMAWLLINSGYCGELTNSQKQGIIPLILKKGKDKRMVGSYHLITLLNVDLKIGSKAIAARVSKVLPVIIGEEQAAFVKDRYIGDAVRTVADVIQFTKFSNTPGILLNIDFEESTWFSWPWFFEKSDEVIQFWQKYAKMGSHLL